jgi:ATP synthase F1 delta subunit
VKYTIKGTNVAKKYAKAFLHCFPHITFASIMNIEKAQQFLQDHRRALFFLQLPQFTEQTRLSMVEDLVAYFSLPQECVHILLLLLKHDRSFLIPEVLFFIVLLYKENNTIVDFIVKSSHHIDEKQKKTMALFLERNFGKKSICTFAIDNRLIAGIRAQSTEYIWEYSVRKQLQSLRVSESKGKMHEKH